MARDIAEDLHAEAEDVKAQLGAMESYLRDVEKNLEELSDADVTKKTVDQNLRKLQRLQMVIGSSTRKEMKEFKKLGTLLKNLVGHPSTTSQMKKDLNKMLTELRALEAQITLKLSRYAGGLWRTIKDLNEKEASLQALKKAGHSVDSATTGDVSGMIDKIQEEVRSILEIVRGAIVAVESLQNLV